MSNLIAQVNPEAPYPLTPQPALIVLLIAVLLGWGCYRLAQTDLLSRLRPHLLIGTTVFWGLAVIKGSLALALALTSYWLPLGLFILAVVALTNLDWMRNVMAAIHLAFEDRFDVGDSIRVDSTEGEVLDFGLRATRIRGIDGQLHEVPNQRFTGDAVTNLTGKGDCACDLTVTVPEGMATARARKLARRAAVLSPLASPRHAPEVFTTADDPASGTVQLNIRGYAFDPNYQDHFRSDVTTRLLEAFDGEKVPPDNFRTAPETS